MAEVHSLVTKHAATDTASVRVRFVRFGSSSLEVDIYAYVFARDRNNFREIQESLLLSVMDIAHKAGVGIAFPSQTLYLAIDTSEKLTQPIRDDSEQNRADARSTNNQPSGPSRMTNRGTSALTVRATA